VLSRESTPSRARAYGTVRVRAIRVGRLAPMQMPEAVGLRR
jgi:hypothetical protein